jgi:hypothetical protein
MNKTHVCCFCPVEVRNLFATAHNVLVRWDNGSMSSSLPEKMEDLRAALQKCEPLLNKHFEEEDR